MSFQTVQDVASFVVDVLAIFGGLYAGYRVFWTKKPRLDIENVDISYMVPSKESKSVNRYNVMFDIWNGKAWWKRLRCADVHSLALIASLISEDNTIIDENRNSFTKVIYPNTKAQCTIVLPYFPAGARIRIKVQYDESSITRDVDIDERIRRTPEKV